MKKFKFVGTGRFVYCGVCGHFRPVSRWGMLYRGIAFLVEQLFGPYTFWFKCPYCGAKIWALSYLERI